MESKSKFYYCINCSSHLSKDPNEKRKATFYQIPKSTLPMIELDSGTTIPIKIHSALSKIYKLNYFHDLKFLMDDEQFPLLSAEKESKAGVCNDCYLAFLNLVKYYNKFNNLRLKNSYLSTTISKLDGLMHRLEGIVDNSQNSQIKSEENSDDENEEMEQEESTTILNHDEMSSSMDYQESDSSHSSSRNLDSTSQIDKNLQNPKVLISRLTKQDIPTTTTTATTSKKIDYVTISDSEEEEDIKGNFDFGPRSNEEKDPLALSPTKIRTVQSSSGYRLAKPPDKGVIIIKDNTCPLCQKKFKITSNVTPHIIDTHMDTEDNTKFPCPLPSCDCIYRQRSALLGHIKRTHLRLRSIQCPVPNCPVSYEKRHLLGVHLKTHWKSGLYYCDKCPEPFGSIKLLSTHIATTHPSIVNTCPACPGTRFETEVGLMAHIKSEHMGQNIYQCTICAQSFQYRRRLINHTNICHQPDGLRCDLGCGTSSRFKTEERLRRHQEKCMGLQTFPCSICGRVFKDKGHCQKHELSHQGEDAGIKCSHEGCGKVFFSNYDFKRHEQRHTPDRPYVCHECGMSFKDRKTLQTHFLVHSQVKDWLCNVCAKTFKKEDALKKHLRMHNEEKIQYPCSKCDKVFQYPESRLVHFRTKHEPSPGVCCQICGDKFPFPCNLKRHMTSAHKN